MYVAPPLDPSPLAAAFVQSGPSVGVPIVEDYNGPTMEGTALFNLTVKDGKRNSVASVYLRPAMSRSNLVVATGAHALRVTLEGTRCVGVEYVSTGATIAARATQEVILAAGVVGSPRLLMLSGIGAAGSLSRLGIAVAVNLPGVGQNLHDHVLAAAITYECKGPLPAPRNNCAEATMWWKSDARLPAPDIQPVFIEVPFVTPELAPALPSPDCYCIAPSVVRVSSRGAVTLASSDPTVDPIINPNFLDRDCDVDTLLVALELCREIGASDAFKEFRKREVMPGNRSRSDMISFLRQSATTYFHPVGTCKMGGDEMAVVDSQLRVYGIQGLRVADASIMPTVTSGNTNAPSVMIGEMAAALVQAASRTQVVSAR